MAEARSGELFFNLAVTLTRVFLAFTLAMAPAPQSASDGRALADRLGDPWLVVLLNLPALVIIVLAYVWGGLTGDRRDPGRRGHKFRTAVTVREGARALDPGLDEMAQAFAVPRWKISARVLPQTCPYLATAARSGLSLIWKIVLVVELLGRPNGVGFEIGIAFQLFDVTRILAYAMSFIAIVLAIETLLVQPFERHASVGGSARLEVPIVRKAVMAVSGERAEVIRESLSASTAGWSACWSARPDAARRRCSGSSLASIPIIRELSSAPLRKARHGVPGAAPAAVADRGGECPACRARRRPSQTHNVFDGWNSPLTAPIPRRTSLGWRAALRSPGARGNP